MKSNRPIVVTGTDTGIGKTVVTALLTRAFQQLGAETAALKPMCSGGRADPRALHAAMNGRLALDEINPWHYRAPLAPVLAARREQRRAPALATLLRHARRLGQEHRVLLIEGAGGLLSPFGPGYNTSTLIQALRAIPVVVCPNRLGAVNQSLLVLAALPAWARARAQVLLIEQRRPDSSASSNAALLAEHFDPRRIHSLPWLGRTWNTEAHARHVRAVAARLLAAAATS